MKSLFDWHTLYVLCVDIQRHLEPWVRTIIRTCVGVPDGLSSGNQTPYKESALPFWCKGYRSFGRSSFPGRSCRFTLPRNACLRIGMLLKS